MEGVVQLLLKKKGETISKLSSRRSLCALFKKLSETWALYLLSCEEGKEGEKAKWKVET